eukprot:TRINITY_DN24387_c0_g1_i1.p1 TRINITY_DN24387_c0_g1~~TRINITY_DN24387_c0_g1_i1.p1  ORF type:complete len:421 (-),score=53.34 TRINITY_DN24387_c0_g1_i1:33-1295(-)
MSLSMRACGVTVDDRDKARGNYYARVFRPGLHRAAPGIRPEQKFFGRVEKAGMLQCPWALSGAMRPCRPASASRGKVQATPAVSQRPSSAGHVQRSSAPQRPSSAGLGRRPTIAAFHVKRSASTSTVHRSVSTGRVHYHPPQPESAVMEVQPRQPSTVSENSRKHGGVPSSCSADPASGSSEKLRQRPRSAPPTFEGRRNWELSQRLHTRSTELSPGPGHYNPELPTRPLSARSMPSSWARRGTLPEDCDLASCEMYNLTGPCTFLHQDRHGIAKEIPSRKFSERSTTRDCPGTPLHGQVEARYTHQIPKACTDKEATTWTWDAWYQALQLSSRCSAAARLDHFSKQAHLEFPAGSAGRRLGGELILVRGNDTLPRKYAKAIPPKSIARKRSGERAEQQRAVVRSRSVGKGFGFSRARRF